VTDLEAEFLDFQNFDRAWQKIADNRGCAGIDGETIEMFGRRASQNLVLLRDTIANGRYLPSPCQQVLIPKTQDSHRALSIPTVRERIIQQALLNILNPIVDRQLSPVSFAYRPQVSYLQAVEAVAQGRDAGYEWVMDADIVKYFANIDRQILLQKLRKYIDVGGILWLVKGWISCGIVTTPRLRSATVETIFPDRGIP
jgi:retron-type reverse transcriptase